MEQPLILTFDIGTQSMRGLLVDTRGTIVNLVQYKYEKPYYSKKPGWAEQSPDYYYQILCSVSKELKGKSTNGYNQVIGVTLTAIRDSTLCLDKDNKPLRDIILWLDGRKATKVRTFRWYETMTFLMCGMNTSVKLQYKSSAANWIMEHERELWERTNKFVMLPTYLNYKLTGELRDSPTNMVGHIPFDFKHKCWQNAHSLKRCVCDIPTDKMCELIDSLEVIGSITSSACDQTGIPKGLPLYATGSDKGCETLGLSVLKEDQAAISFGTTATIQFATKKYFEPQKFMPAYPAVPNDMYNPEIQVYRGYWLISWFKNEFAHKEVVEAKEIGCSPEDILNKHLRDVPPGCEGLVLQPFWTPGMVTPNARGAIIGFFDVHTRIHIYRAIIEGIGFALMDGMYHMERKSKQKIRELYVAGGGSQSDEICQITANIFGLPVKRVQTHEVSGLGSSLAGFVAAKVFSTYEEAIEAMVHVESVFYPDMKEHKLYDNLYRFIYRRIYRKLLPLYKRMKKSE